MSKKSSHRKWKDNVARRLRCIEIIVAALLCTNFANHIPSWLTPTSQNPSLRTLKAKTNVKSNGIDFDPGFNEEQMKAKHDKGNKEKTEKKAFTGSLLANPKKVILEEQKQPKQSYDVEEREKKDFGNFSSEYHKKNTEIKEPNKGYTLKEQDGKPVKKSSTIKHHRAFTGDDKRKMKQNILLPPPTSTDFTSSSENEKNNNVDLVRTLQDGNNVREIQCTQKPILSPVNSMTGFTYDQRLDIILNIIRGTSSQEALLDTNTAQYKAACYILYDDIDEEVYDDEMLVERYAFTVLLYATNQSLNGQLPSNICSFDGLVCDASRHIIKIWWDNLNIEGSIPSEISLFRHLEFLSLHGNNLIGTLPSEIGRLINLKSIDLLGNNLIGTLPSEVGELTNLKLLGLSHNQLIGTIPSEVGILSDLKELLLNHNNLSGSIPKEIGHCSQLEMLHLYENDLDGKIPDDLFDCTKLTDLSLFSNNLDGTISSKIGQLQELEILWLKGNHLSGRIPTETGTLLSLKWLWLSLNELTGPVPEEWQNLTALEYLWISDNLLTGSLPDIFGNLKNLTFIRFSDNKFYGTIPQSLWEMDSLSRLFMEGNELEGTVPPNFCNQLEGYRFDTSSWFIEEPKVKCECCGAEQGCLAWEVGDRPILCPSQNVLHVEYFYWYDIQDLTSSTNLFKLNTTESHDTDLCLSPTGCYTIETITPTFNPNPESWHEVLQFYSFSNSSKSLIERDEFECQPILICGTSFNMTDPKRSKFNHLTQLVDIFSENAASSLKRQALCKIMTNDILLDDYEICDGTLLQRYVLLYLYIDMNMPDVDDFSELLSKPTCKWPGVTCNENENFVEHLSFTNRNLTGTLATEIGLLRGLKSIDFSRNMLGGKIKEMMFHDLPFLESFNADNNEFEGEIPKQLLQIPVLKNFNISSNLIGGTLPDEIAYSESLESFIVGDNLLQGTIPQSLFDCDNLQTMKLSKNGFTGHIPASIGKPREMRVIELQENKLSGSIPNALFNLSSMETLMLQSNQLTGSIPTLIGLFTNTTVIGLDHNNLKGIIPLELTKLKNLEMIHLHQNELTGTAPNIGIESFITDCGEPSYLLSSPLKCDSCTMCCNSERKCQKFTTTKVSILIIAFLVLILLPITIVIWELIAAQIDINFVSRWANNRDLCDTYNNDSVYCFAFGGTYKAWLVCASTAIFQTLLFFVYLQSSNKKDKDTDWKYVFICPGNKFGCSDESNVGLYGWILFVVVVWVFLASDFIHGSLQIRKAFAMQNIQLMLGGLVLFSVTALAFFTTIAYNLAVAETATELIMNAVILLFINDLDEKVMTVATSFGPRWTETTLEEVMEFMSSKDSNDPKDDPQSSLSDVSIVHN